MYSHNVKKGCLSWLILNQKHSIAKCLSLWFIPHVTSTCFLYHDVLGSVGLTTISCGFTSVRIIAWLNIKSQSNEQTQNHKDQVRYSQHRRLYILRVFFVCSSLISCVIICLHRNAQNDPTLDLCIVLYCHSSTILYTKI